jgi:hypothetical protein
MQVWTLRSLPSGYYESTEQRGHVEILSERAVFRSADLGSQYIAADASTGELLARVDRYIRRDRRND